MATQLNIKDPILIARVRDLAERQGKSVTATLRAVVDKEWDAQEAERDAYVAGVTAWLDKVRKDMPDDVKGMTSKQLMDAIYDDHEPDGFAR